MPAKRRGKAVLLRSSPAFSFATSERPKPCSRMLPPDDALQLAAPPHSDVYSWSSSVRLIFLDGFAGDVPGPGTYNVHGDAQKPVDVKRKAERIRMMHCHVSSVHTFLLYGL